MKTYLVFEPKSKGACAIIAKRHMVVLDSQMPGEAQGLYSESTYEYGRTPRKSNPKTWTKYIAKISSKWYPNEGITEHLLNRIGYILGWSC
ncbi:MAG: hypothetical protein R2792_04240 [Saprospiraceae bacterium]